MTVVHFDQTRSEDEVPEENNSPDGVRVILADSQAIYRVGMKKVFAVEDDIRVVAQVEIAAVKSRAWNTVRDQPCRKALGLEGAALVHAAEVVLLEPVALAPAQPLEHLAQAHQVFAVAVLEARLHHPPERGVEVAVVQEIVGHLLEQRVGVEVEADLRTVPARIPKPRAHKSTVPRRGYGRSS